MKPNYRAWHKGPNHKQKVSIGEFESVGKAMNSIRAVQMKSVYWSDCFEIENITTGEIFWCAGPAPKEDENGAKPRESRFAEYFDPHLDCWRELKSAIHHENRLEDFCREKAAADSTTPYRIVHIFVNPDHLKRLGGRK